MTPFCSPVYCFLSWQIAGCLKGLRAGFLPRRGVWPQAGLGCSAALLTHPARPLVPVPLCSCTSTTALLPKSLILPALCVVFGILRNTYGDVIVTLGNVWGCLRVGRNNIFANSFDLSTCYVVVSCCKNVALIEQYLIISVL